MSCQCIIGHSALFPKALDMYGRILMCFNPTVNITLSNVIFEYVTNNKGKILLSVMSIMFLGD